MFIYLLYIEISILNSIHFFKLSMLNVIFVAKNSIRFIRRQRNPSFSFYAEMINNWTGANTMQVTSQSQTSQRGMWPHAGDALSLSEQGQKIKAIYSGQYCHLLVMKYPATNCHPYTSLLVQQTQSGAGLVLKQTWGVSVSEALLYTLHIKWYLHPTNPAVKNPWHCRS